MVAQVPQGSQMSQPQLAKVFHVGESGRRERERRGGGGRKRERKCMHVCMQCDVFAVVWMYPIVNGIWFMQLKNC